MRCCDRPGDTVKTNTGPKTADDKTRLDILKRLRKDDCMMFPELTHARRARINRTSKRHGERIRITTGI
jgi:hypothetical protein